MKIELTIAPFLWIAKQIGEAMIAPIEAMNYVLDLRAAKQEKIRADNLAEADRHFDASMKINQDMLDIMQANHDLFQRQTRAMEDIAANMLTMRKP
jgi:hypothetical protein